MQDTRVSCKRDWTTMKKTLWTFNPAVKSPTMYRWTILVQTCSSYKWYPRCRGEMELELLCGLPSGFILEGSVPIHGRHLSINKSGIRLWAICDVIRWSSCDSDYTSVNNIRYHSLVRMRQRLHQDRRAAPRQTQSYCRACNFLKMVWSNTDARIDGGRRLQMPRELSSRQSVQRTFWSVRSIVHICDRFSLRHIRRWSCVHLVYTSLVGSKGLAHQHYCNVDSQLCVDKPMSRILVIRSRFLWSNSFYSAFWHFWAIPQLFSIILLL